jgi:glycogen operon protein
MDWGGSESCLAVYIDGSETEVVGDEPDDDFYILFNGSKHTHRFSLPSARPGHRWTRVIYTGAAPPHDIREPGYEDELEHPRRIVLMARSMALLQSKS